LTQGYRKVWGESVKEARKVFKAMGVPIQRGPRGRDNFLVQKMETLLNFPTILVQIILLLKQTKGGKTSMLQDLENHADETEIEFITGRIVSLGKEFNIPTPISEKLVELVKDATARKQGSPKIGPEQLMKAVGLDVNASFASNCSVS
jgi:ketopantoate reductase